MPRRPPTRCWDGSRSGCCAPFERPTESIWPTFRAASCARSVRALRSTASVAPILPPPFRKNPAEIESILRGVWDNLGRVAAEFAHIDRLQIFDPDPQAMGDIVYTPQAYERFQQLRLDGKPALIFAAHLA